MARRHGGTAWLFNPWTGSKRHASDVGSDPYGLLIVPDGEPLRPVVPVWNGAKKWDDLLSAKAAPGAPTTNKWHQRFIEMARLVACWSKDPSTQVGAVLVGADREILAVGYNGFARGTSDEGYHDKEFKHRHVIHAEENAILNAARSGTRIQGATLYVTHHPCCHCTGVLIQAGVTMVVCPGPCQVLVEKWALAESRERLEAAGVFTTYL